MKDRAIVGRVDAVDKGYAIAFITDEEIYSVRNMGPLNTEITWTHGGTTRTVEIPVSCSIHIRGNTDYIYVRALTIGKQSVVEFERLPL